MIEMIQENKNAILQNTVGFLKLSVQFSSVSQLCLTLCDLMNRSTPGLPVHHQLPEFTQTHVHRVGDAIQPSHPLSSPSPPAPNPSGSFPMSQLFAWGGQSIGVSNCQENPRKKKKNSVYLIKHIILLSKCQTPHLFRVKYILVKTEICSQVQSNLTLTGVDKWDHKLGWGWMGRSKSNFCKVIAC